MDASTGDGASTEMAPGTTGDPATTAQATTMDAEVTTDSTGAVTSEVDVDVVPAAPSLALGFSATKQFDFSWAPAAGADHYQLLERTGAEVADVLLADELTQTAVSLAMPLHLRAGASYVLRACNDAGCGESEPAAVTSAMTAAIGYLKASNAESSDNFGAEVAVSADGTTLVVSAPREASSATSINGVQSDNLYPSAGAAYVFIRDGRTWVQQAYLKAFNAGSGDRFGYEVAISADGNTIAVGATDESSAAIGIGGAPLNDDAPQAGAVYVFVRHDGAWSQQAYVKASNTSPGDGFGASLALSASGDVLAVGASGESSATKGVDGPQQDESADAAGAVYVFSRSGETWAQRAYIKASNSEEADGFGHSCALSGDGRTLVVGAPGEDGGGAGVGAEQEDNASPWSGAAYVYVANEGAWSQQAFLKASNADEEDFFGSSVAISGDGDRIAVGAFNESGSAPGMGGLGDGHSGNASGAVYMFSRSKEFWTEEAYLKAPNAGGSDSFGTSLALSSDGSTLGIGATREDGSDVGVDGDQTGNWRSDSGAVYVFQRQPGAWNFRSYVKASNTDVDDGFGASLSLSGDGETLVVGATQEASAAKGVGGPQGDNSAAGAGAVYVY